MLELSKQTVLLTGAAQGLGAAIARHFSLLGAKLVLLDCNAEGLARTVEQCASNTLSFKVDLSSRTDTTQTLEKVLAEVVAVDTLIHNAAVLKPELFESQNFEDFRATLDVGLQAAFLLTKAVWPGMAQRRSGVLIFVSSRSGVEGFARESAYCATKHGLEGLSKSLALEGREHGIVSLTITPGMLMHTPTSELTYSAEERLRWVEPDVLASSFALLAEERSLASSGLRHDAWKLLHEESR